MRNELIGQILRFCVVGAMNTLVGLLAIYVNLFVFGMGDLAANLFGYVFGLLFGFFFHRNWTFRARHATWFGALKYALAFAVSYGMNLVCVLALRRMDVASALAQAGGVVPYVVSFFLLSRYMVFRQPPKA